MEISVTRMTDNTGATREFGEAPRDVTDSTVFTNVNFKFFLNWKFAGVRNYFLTVLLVVLCSARVEI